MNDMTLAMDVMMKIVSGMFFNGPGLVIVGMFAMAGVVYYIKAKLEQN